MFLLKLIKIRSIDILRFLYNILPMRLTHGKEYYNTYISTYKFLKKSDKWDKKQFIEYQNMELKNLINYAYNNVPYYRELFDKNKISPDEIKTQADLYKIPILTKKIIRMQGNRMVSESIPKKNIIRHYTGGSTGKPVEFCFEKKCFAKEQAFVQNIYDRIGYNKNEKTIIFEDPHFLRQEQEIYPNKFYKRMPGTNKWYFSYALLSDETFLEFRKAINKINPKWIITNPSSLYQYTKICQKNNILPFEITDLQGIIFKSEVLYPFQLDLFKKMFSVKFLHVYGHTEMGCIAGTCEKELKFHIQPEYGVSEFINSKRSNEKKVLITTGFNNYVMPLIRYYTEDLFELDNSTCICTREMPLIKSIEGRASDYLYLKDGRMLSDIFCDFTTISKFDSWIEDCIRYRILQNEIGKCIVEYIPISDSIDKEILREKIKTSCEEFFFNQMDVEPREVKNIPMTLRGKDRLIVSTIEK